MYLPTWTTVSKALWVEFRQNDLSEIKSLGQKTQGPLFIQRDEIVIFEL